MKLWFSQENYVWFAMNLVFMALGPLLLGLVIPCERGHYVVVCGHTPLSVNSNLPLFRTFTVCVGHSIQGGEWGIGPGKIWRGNIWFSKRWPILPLANFFPGRNTPFASPSAMFPFLMRPLRAKEAQTLPLL